MCDVNIGIFFRMKTSTNEQKKAGRIRLSKFYNNVNNMYLEEK